MITRPPGYLNWTDGAPAKVVQPPGNFLLEGWDPGQAPPSQYMNWLFYTTDQWIKYLDALTSTGVPDQALRLINGGFWSFNATTGAFAWSAIANIAIPGTIDSANAISAGAVTLADGDIAYVNMTLPVLAQASGAIGTDLLTNMSFTGNLSIGMSVQGPGIPGGTTVLAVNPASVQISANLTADETNQTFFFSTINSMTMQVAASSTFIPSFGTLLIGRRVGNQVYVGLNANLMNLKDGEFKKLGADGYLQSHDTVLAGENLTQGQVFYISPGSDGGRIAGRAYKLDCSAGNPLRSNFAGIAISNVITGDPVPATFSGFYKSTGLSPGHLYYGNPAVTGGIVADRPSTLGASIMPIGLAISTTVLLLTNAEGIPAAPQNQSIFIEDELGVGPTSVFLLSQAPLDANSTFVFIDGLVIPKAQWTLVGQTLTIIAGVTVGQSVEAKYIQANQFSISGTQEVPTTSDRITWQLTGLPLNQASTFVYVDGLKLAPSEFSLVLGTLTAQVILPSALPVGQDLYVSYIQNVGSTSGSNVIGGTNEGSGFGVFDNIVANVMRFLSLKAGPNVTIAPDGFGSLIISSNVASAYTRGLYGTPGTPATFVPSAGLAPGVENDQTWIIKPTSGATPVTAVPQIVAGTIIGQRLYIRGVSAVDYYKFRGTSGSVVDGLSLNGDCDITNNQTLILEWDGTVWYEIGRRS